MRRGTLRFVTSPMNAGKTANMLMKAKHARSRGKTVVIAKPAVDTRHKKLVVKSRCGIEMGCDLDVDSKFSFARDVSYAGVDFLFVDEAQFLTARQVEELREVADGHGVAVWCYGLLTDFKRSLFEGSKRLVELCDKMAELDVTCHFCEEGGRFHLKYIGGKASVDGPSVEISGPGQDKFVSVCHMCWVEKTEASTEVLLSAPPHADVLSVEKVLKGIN